MYVCMHTQTTVNVCNTYTISCLGLELVVWKPMLLSRRPQHSKQLPLSIAAIVIPPHEHRGPAFNSKTPQHNMTDMMEKMIMMTMMMMLMLTKDPRSTAEHKPKSTTQNKNKTKAPMSRTLGAQNPKVVVIELKVPQLIQWWIW